LKLSVSIYKRNNQNKLFRKKPKKTKKMKKKKKNGKNWKTLIFL
jgi:hypothetical protein